LGHSEQGNQPHTRPSLLSNSDQNSTAGVNILSGLGDSGKEKQTTPSTGKKILYFCALTMLLVAGGATLMYFQDSVPPPSPKSVTRTSDPASSPALPLSNAMNVAASAAGLPNDQLSTAASNTATVEGITEKNIGAAAIITNEVSEKQDTKPPENPFSGMVSSEKNAVTAPSNTTTKSSSLQDKRSSDKPGKNPGVAINEAKKESAPKLKNNNSAENDIALISALISRGSDSDRHKVKPDKHTQDIVERKPGDKTKNLLARCKNLGGLEADLCRSRICSGQWANESACLAPDNTSSRVNSSGNAPAGDASAESN
jgi:hypothetical protein